VNVALEPSLLRWARERAGLSEDALAKKVGAKPERVLEWERTGRLGFGQAEKVAKATHTPFGYLCFATPQGLNMQILGRLWLGVPRLDEQDAILAAVGVEAAKLQSAIDAASRSSSLLREYRTRLIADVVTGKLDVRDAATRLQDEAYEPEPLDEASIPNEVGDEVAEDLDGAFAEVEA